MSDEETREFWDGTASDWERQVGIEGDKNRRLNSDPVLWQMAGSVSGLDVLDAGCGTGYLTVKLAGEGARVVGVDFSPEMIELAKRRAPQLDFRVDSCCRLDTFSDSSFDLLISNYVLMDLPDLHGAMDSFFRVLRKGGRAVLVFSHPCFPLSDAFDSPDGKSMGIMWPHPYFVEKKRIDPPWGHFKRDFIRFHRPLSLYWKAFIAAGFTIKDFDEPVQPNAPERSLARPCSVAFMLQK